MMRGGKDEKEMMSPMFPRVHVNETGKGRVPRPPPRNQMALYEQFSVPSQRHISGSLSLWSLPPNTTTSNSTSSIPSFPSDHGCGRPFSNSPTPSHLAEKLQSSSHNGIQSSSAVGSHEVKTSKTSPSLSAKGSLLSSVKPNSFQSYSFSNFRNFSIRNLDSSNSLKVSTFSQSGADACCESAVSPANSCLSLQLQITNRKPVKRSDVGDENPKEYVRSQCEEDATEGRSCCNPPQRSGSLLLERDRGLMDTSLSSLSKIKNSESLKRPHGSLNQDIGSSSADAFNNIGLRDSLSLECSGAIGRRSASKVKNELSPKKLIGFSGRNQDKIETTCGGKQITGLDRGDGIFDSSGMDSAAALNLSSNDVIRVIGKKQFWQVRAVIINQQKIFALQVFELHRLIKVQTLFAGSPKLLLEDNLCTDESAPLKKSSSDLEPDPLVKADKQSQKWRSKTEFSDEPPIPKLSLPSISEKLVPQQPNPLAANAKPSPWCFLAPGNQWLVPVMSPSEGLVYKPYTGPSPPTSGFMGSSYGNDLFSTAYGFPAPQESSPTYLPPYGMQFRSPPLSYPAIEQMNPFVQSQASCGMSTNISQAKPCFTRKPHASKESEILGSTASSPPEKSKCDVLPLFPTEPTHQAIEQNGQSDEDEQTQPQLQPQPLTAIKVVPHNPRSSSESAARIFRSIQEERKQCSDYTIS